MEKRDYKKELKQYYNPTAKEVTDVEVPAMNFITIEGKGSPDSTQFAEAIQALFPIAYAIKFYFKKNEGLDYSVMPLEGLWWAEDMNAFDQNNPKRDEWSWKLMIMQPDFVTAEVFQKLKIETITKKGTPPMENVSFENYKEGKSFQIMHIGPFSEEGPNIAKLHERIKDLGAKPSGNHHEIYLSDFRKADPKKMKTVLRQPYK